MYTYTCVCLSCSVVSDSLWPHRLKPAWLLCPLDSPAKNTGVGSHSLLQGIFQPRDQTQVSCIAGRFFHRLSHEGSLYIYVCMCIYIYIYIYIYNILFQSLFHYRLLRGIVKSLLNGILVSYSWISESSWGFIILVSRSKCNSSWSVAF